MSLSYSFVDRAPARPPRLVEALQASNQGKASPAFQVVQQLLAHGGERRQGEVSRLDLKHLPVRLMDAVEGGPELVDDGRMQRIKP